MIRINLLPEDLRLQNSGILTPQDYAVYAAAALLGLLLLLHALLGFIFIVREFKLGLETAVWQNQGQLIKKVEDFKQEYGYLFQDDSFLGQGGPAISWSEKLYRLTSDLPGGVWLNEIFLTDRNFSLKGSIISLQKNEVGLLNAYIDGLKKDYSFYKDFVSLDPGPLKRRVIATYDVVDFSMQGSLKAR